MLLEHYTYTAPSFKSEKQAQLASHIVDAYLEQHRHMRKLRRFHTHNHAIDFHANTEAMLSVLHSYGPGYQTGFSIQMLEFVRGKSNEIIRAITDIVHRVKALDKNKTATLAELPSRDALERILGCINE